ncbi:glycoprotein H [Cercopithecine alphaherpesvirus 9]|uniref:Glycoprotein H n=2 Tax=Cercopithecine alphaherpesvirus 9 TaxID=35246 RepID=A0A2D0TCK1_CHV9D|nr:envelope glycoprotein H [Cercopithecine alphaherpesvirus 9]AAB04139.1 gH [Cercopithecine alphaherpesvirus 9]AAG27211.1 glycoprotein H [Cercopithecine alphaherpesvirus 9]
MYTYKIVFVLILTTLHRNHAMENTSDETISRNWPFGHMSAMLRDYSHRNISLKLDAYYPTNFNENYVKSLQWGDDKDYIFFVTVKMEPLTYKGDVDLVIFPRMLLNRPTKLKSPPRAPFVAGRFGLLSHPVSTDINFFEFGQFAPYLTTQHLIDFSVLPSNFYMWRFDRSDSTATAEEPFGISLLPTRPTAPRDVVLEKKVHIHTWEMLNTHMFFSTEVMLNNATLKTHVPLFASVWPIQYWETISVLLASNTGRIEINVGVGFLSVLISLEFGSPIEILVVPHTVNLAAITSNTKAWFQYNPPGPDPGPTYQVHILGRGVHDNEDFSYDLISTMAAYPEESLDYRYHLSMANFEVLKMFLQPKRSLHESVYHYYRIAARLATAIFALCEMGRNTEYFLLDEVVDLNSNIQLLTDILMQICAGANSNTILINTDLNIYNSKQLYEETLYLFKNPYKQITLDFTVTETAVNVLKTLYAFSNNSASTEVLLFLNNVLTAQYRESLFNHELNVTNRQALFLSMALLLKYKHSHGINVSYVTQFRRALLMMTSMCTSLHATQDSLNLQQAFAMYDFTTIPFSLINEFSPCMASLRRDLIEEPHVMDIIASVSTKPALSSWIHKHMTERELLDFTYQTVFMFNNWTTPDINTLQDLFPELFTCNDNSILNGDYVLILPAGIGYSYIITRQKAVRGLIYSLSNVDVYNPITVTYVNVHTCVEEHGLIETVALPHPDNLKECLYCGSVFLRYLTTGTIMDVIIIDDKDTERQLAALENSTVTAFNPDVHGDNSKAVLLFPNGTIVSLLGFERAQGITVSGQYIGASFGGAFLALIAFAGIGWMLCGSPRNIEYTAVPLV